MTKVFEEFLEFSVESKSILLWFSFTSFCDWSTKLAPLSQPIRCKTKTIATLSFAFSRASGSLLVSTWSPHWLLMTSIFFLINVITFVLVLKHSIKTALITESYFG